MHGKYRPCKDTLLAAWKTNKVKASGHPHVVGLAVVQARASRLLDLLKKTYMHCNRVPASKLDTWIKSMGHGSNTRHSGPLMLGRRLGVLVPATVRDPANMHLSLGKEHGTTGPYRLIKPKKEEKKALARLEALILAVDALHPVPVVRTASEWIQAVRSMTALCTPFKAPGLTGHKHCLSYTLACTLRALLITRMRSAGVKKLGVQMQHCLDISDRLSQTKRSGAAICRHGPTQQ